MSPDSGPRLSKILPASTGVAPATWEGGWANRPFQPSFPAPANAQLQDGDQAAPIKVLTVDDSALIRLLLNRHLSTQQDIQVVGQARDGKEALELVEKLHPDVMTLDVEMPQMNGLETLQHLMVRSPLPVIMLSSLTSDGASVTLRALELGAVDFVLKPRLGISMEETAAELIQKVRIAAKTRVQSRPDPGAPVDRLADVVGIPSSRSVEPLQETDRLLFIASSTGGPSALADLLTMLPGNLPVAGVIVQHMPAGFTKTLSQRLDRVSLYRVKEAEAGDRIERGQFLVAAGGYHLAFTDQGQVRLEQGPPVNGVRPAADVTMRSLAALYSSRVLAVILTGMGHDGRAGSQVVRSLGGTVLAQNEESCVVYGMPRSVVEANLVEAVAPPRELSRIIAERIRKNE
jgi:two-component system, chemotaxis family, protein-glutamate methylesterase/glutaminase